MPSDNSNENPAQTDGPPHPPPPQLNFLTMTPQADSKICSDGFLAMFLNSWLEDLVTDATSRRIWNLLHQSHSDADAIYSTLNY